MTKSVKNILKKIKTEFKKLIDDEPIGNTTYLTSIDEEQVTILGYLKSKFLNDKKIWKVNNAVFQKKYFNQDQAIYIANSDKNLKKYMYREAINNGYIYGIIELNKFYTTLVKYHNDLYWYVKVLDGKYGLQNKGKNVKGLFNEYSNIRCLVNALTGKFIYIDDNFDTRNIRMISDDEFLEILFDLKK